MDPGRETRPVINVPADNLLRPEGSPPPRRSGPGLSNARLAWTIAIAADFVQVIALPAFAPGLAAPWTIVLDVVVAVAMVRLLGWHVAFLPTFVAELVPFVDLFPSWTLAVLFVTRGRRG